MKFAAIVVLSIVCWCGVVAAATPVRDAVQPHSADDDGRPIPCLIKCRRRGAYNLPHLRNCEQFYRCVHGVALELRCPGWDVFDHVTMRCASFYEARCLLEGPTNGTAELEND